MEVRCPACSSRFRIADALIVPGVRFRCSVCGNIFSEQHAAPDAALEAAPPGSPAADMESAPAQASVPSEAPVSEEENPAAAQTIAIEKATSEAARISLSMEPGVAEQPRAAVSSAQTGLSLDRPSGFAAPSLHLSPSSRPRRRWWLWLLLLLLLGAGGGWWYSHASHPLPPFLKKDSPGTPQAVQEQWLERKNVRQYYVQNAKVGQILVVEGQLFNPTSTPQRQAELECTLYDASRKPLLVKKQFASGVSLSPLQLKMLDATELEKLVRGDPSMQLAPESGVQFTILFYAPPVVSVSTFGVKIVRAQENAAERSAS